MAGMTQTLQVVRVNEQRPASAMRSNVVNIGRPDAQTAPRALSAERLTQKLLWSEDVSKDWKLIPGMPGGGCRRTASRVLRLMLIAVDISRHRAAADMCAWFQWF